MTGFIIFCVVALFVLVFIAFRMLDIAGARIVDLEKRMDRVDPWDSGALPGVGDRVVMNEGGPFPTVTKYAPHRSASPTTSPDRDRGRAGTDWDEVSL